VNRLHEMLSARNLSGRIVFTGMYNRLTSMDVRARQIGDALGASYIRGKYLMPDAARRARCVIWVAVADAQKVRAIGDAAPQVFDIINPSVEKGEPYFDLVDEFETLILNTRSTLDFLRSSGRRDRRTYVIPHHHCNVWNFALPEERVARPRTVGYVGEPGHLHDSGEIQAAAKALGLQWVAADPHNLTAYKTIDIGVAWTKPEELRDKTRSNIKMTNFCAFGIPSVVCDYESYRDVDEKLGGGAAVIARTLPEFLEGFQKLATDEELRRSVHEKALPARELYSRAAVAGQYLSMVEEIERK
jgi:hypothetical protein